MQLLLIGCEYVGKTTLAVQLSKWMIGHMSVPLVRWHNHYVVPNLDTHLLITARDDGSIAVPGKQEHDLNTQEDEEQILSLRPSVLEQLTRHMIWRHLHPDLVRDDDVMTINGHYADAVYAPLYYGFGERGSFADRFERARAWDGELIAIAPDTVLVLMKADAKTVRRRMAETPRARTVLKEQDVERILGRFQEEYSDSLLPRRFTIDTTDVTVEDSLEKFLSKMEPHFSEVDRRRLVSESGA